MISTVVCSMGTAAVLGPGGAALFKRAGQGPPPSLLPSVFCLPAYLKAPPPASSCLDAGSAAEIKTPRQSQGGGGGHKGKAAPELHTSRGQPRAAAPQLAVLFSSSGEKKISSASCSLAKVQINCTLGRSGGARQHSVSKPLIALQVSAPTLPGARATHGHAALAQAPARGGKGTERARPEEPGPSITAENSAKAPSVPQAPSAAGAAQRPTAP